MNKTFSTGGVHPHDNKFSRDCAIEELPLPKRIFISMNQHLGAPAKPVVAKGDHVLTGQPIAQRGGFVSACIHASCTGTVVDVAPYPDFMGNKVMTIVIDVEPDMWMSDIVRSQETITTITCPTDQIVSRIEQMGIVGLGGAAFPTHIKLTPPPTAVPRWLLLNGTECEPYLTSDFRLMMESPQEVLIGGEIMRRALGAEVQGLVCIEANKPEAIANMRALLPMYPHWDVVVLKKRYPQGGEKQLIDAVLKKRVPSMALPVVTGTVVQNVGTSFAVYEAIQKNQPLIYNVLSVTGTDSALQHNFRFRMGTPIRHILQAAGALQEDGTLLPTIAKVVNGGPMMGKAVVNLDAPVQKSNSALLLLTANQTRRHTPTSCLRCGKCAQACPMGLEPYLLYKLQGAGRTQELQEHYVQDCLECGCCMYVCPAYLPLLDGIRLARAAALKNKRK